jgi:hypothetical protein
MPLTCRRVGMLLSIIGALGSSTMTSQAQGCNEQWVREELQGMSPATSGPACIEDFPASRTVCSPDGQKIRNTALNVKESKNGMLGHSSAEIQSNETCAKFTIGVRTYNHTGSYPGYLCSPGFLKVSVAVSFCK